MREIRKWDTEEMAYLSKMEKSFKDMFFKLHQRMDGLETRIKEMEKRKDCEATPRH